MLKAIHASEDIVAGPEEGLASDREAAGLAFDHSGGAYRQRR
jgi:hypothetical protein